MSGAIVPLLADAALDRLLMLNNEHAEELSLLDMAGFEHLIGQAFLALRAGDGDGFLLAFDQDAEYASPNFIWFRDRFVRFVYVDRVVVAPHARGAGLARAFYARLFDQSKSAGHERVVCEVNSDPPNPASDAFHAALGFKSVGSAAIHGGAKTVRYLERALR